MRVIAGSHRGRRLRAPAGRAVRPTSDRVREALFSILGPLDGLAVLDLFAGSGALGIEALSRGATRVVFVERDPAALACLRANLAGLGTADGSGDSAAEVRAGEARSALRIARSRRETYDLIFIDPPYRDAEAWSAELSTLLPPLLGDGARVVSESDRRSPMSLELPLRDERRYGDTVLRIHLSPT